MINDFQTNNIDMKEIYSISSVYFDHNQNTIAVYPIIRNDERLYELACAKNRNNNYIDIVIYNILLNKKTNVIYHSHVKDEIHNLKHYYYSSEKKHFLLSSNQYEIKLWNISSDIITNELTITPEKNINLIKKIIIVVILIMIILINLYLNTIIILIALVFYLMRKVILFWVEQVQK